VANTTLDQLCEIVRPIDDLSLTLIICSGDFDRGRGEFLVRLVVRAARVER